MNASQALNRLATSRISVTFSSLSRAGYFLMAASA